eukprot:TRINITY_DN14671_c0_g1_i7.p2 TRINITY_DN14671_c0_g1~~TRINITY_DN14671_c0_g1_i7.p2  ORF type:complete len:228 (+),score=-17.43 TRINITY_DN14671_c0_g1_i7:102-785(+)
MRVQSLQQSIPSCTINKPHLQLIYFQKVQFKAAKKTAPLLGNYQDIYSTCCKQNDNINKQNCKRNIFYILKSIIQSRQKNGTFIRKLSGYIFYMLQTKRQYKQTKLQLCYNFSQKIPTKVISICNFKNSPQLITPQKQINFYFNKYIASLSLGPLCSVAHIYMMRLVNSNSRQLKFLASLNFLRKSPAGLGSSQGVFYSLIRINESPLYSIFIITKIQLQTYNQHYY